jgi:tetratricopeptide (TPR) repeat protein
MDPERKLVLGKLMLQTGRLVEGKQYLDQAIKQAHRKDKEAFRLKAAESYLAKGMFGEAEEAFVNVLKSNVNEIEIFNRLGIALRRQGKFKEAIRYYQLALKHHPANAAIHYNLGILHLTLQDKESGQHCFEKALEIDPGFEKAWEILEQLRKGTEPAASQ